MTIYYKGVCMKNLLIVILLSIPLVGCSPEFWAAIESSSPSYTSCSYYDPVYNTLRYHRCNSYIPNGYYYNYPTTYVYRYTPTIIIIDKKDKYKETNTQKKHTQKKDDKKRTSGIDRSNTPSQSKSTIIERSPSPRSNNRGEVRSNQK